MLPSLRCRHYRSHEPMTVDTGTGAVLMVADSDEASPESEPSDLLAPVFVDLQINGFGGVNFSNATELTPEDVATVTRTLWGQGVGYFLPTVTTGGFEDLRRSFEVLAASCRDPLLATSMPAFHLEGPYISPHDGPRGAHRLEHVRPPSWDEFEALQEAAEGRIGLVTLAPEHEGAIPFIERLREEQVIPAIGHTAASTPDIERAVEAGAVLSTHLGNGAHAEIRRHPNYIWDQLADDRLWASLIVDGHHLPANVVKVMTRAKGSDRSILVTDAVTVAGLEPGEYVIEGKRVELTEDNVVKLSGTEYLAGAALTMPEAVHKAARFAELEPETAIDMASQHPRTLLKSHTKVELDVFSSESFTVLRWSDDGLEVVATVLEGRVRHPLGT